MLYETQKYGMTKKTTFNNAMLPTQIMSNCLEQKYMRQYHILVFLNGWTANVCKMQIVQSETCPFMCDLLTKLSCDNFKHEIQNLSLKKWFFRYFSSLLTASTNKYYIPQKTANFVNTWQYKSRLLTANLWTHNTVTMLHKVCKWKKRNRKGDMGLRGTEVRDVCIYHKIVEPNRCDIRHQVLHIILNNLGQQ